MPTEERLIDYCFLSDTRVGVWSSEHKQLTVEFKYFELSEDAVAGQLKEIKFWLYADDALRLSSRLARVAQDVLSED